MFTDTRNLYSSELQGPCAFVPGAREHGTVGLTPRGTDLFRRSASPKVRMPQNLLLYFLSAGYLLKESQDNAKPFPRIIHHQWLCVSDAEVYLKALSPRVPVT